MIDSSSPACITIGNFDGLHLGHQSLVNLAKSIASAKGLVFRLITFWPHPRRIICGEGSHRPLATRAERQLLLRALDVENIIELPFTSELAQMSARDFVSGILVPLGMKELVVGHDFTLGRRREGTFDKLSRLGDEFGFHVTRSPAFELAGTPVSSTRLRQSLDEGNVRAAAGMLGRRYSVSGEIGHGHGRGRVLGFPTANLANPGSMLPANGVYAVFAACEGKVYNAVTNIGFNPTFANSALSVETFLLDADSDFYGREMRLEFVERLRSERRFASTGELAAQIGRDVEQARVILAAAANGR